MLLRLAPLLAREEAWEPAAEPGLEPPFLLREVPVGEGSEAKYRGEKNKKQRVRQGIGGMIGGMDLMSKQKHTRTRTRTHTDLV